MVELGIPDPNLRRLRSAAGVPGAALRAFALGAAMLGLVALATAARAADEIHWTFTGPTSAAFDWRGCESSIRYGLTAAKDLAATARTPSPLPFSSPGPFWEVELTGLRENTLYHYSIGGGPDHTFRTPPARGKSGFSIYAEGDIGDSVAWFRVAQIQDMIAAGLPDFVLCIGDITYAEAIGQEDVDAHYNDLMKWSQDAAYMPAWGNHEWENPAGDDLRNYKGRFAFSNAQTSPGAPSGGCCGEDWYWFDYGNVRFIAYPEPYTSASWPDWYARAVPIMNQAQNDPGIRFIITFGHRPAYSSGFHPGSAALKGYMDALGASHSKYVLNLNGHSHNYERSLPQSGVTHVTSGTGGSNLEQVAGACPWAGGCPAPPWSAFRAMHHVVVRLTFTDTAIQGTVYCGPAGDAGANLNDVTCTQGEVLDSFTIGTVPASSSWYVNNGSGLCSDAGPGTVAQPYCTISAALAAHGGPGATIVVEPGTYREQVDVSASGASGNPLVLKADGAGVVVEAADDFSSPGLWTLDSGDVWLASSVTWSPTQVFASDARLVPFTGLPAAVPTNGFLWVAGQGLYANVGGGNPASLGTLVGRRAHGFTVSGSWVTVDGFQVTHAQAEGISLAAAAGATLTGNTVSYSGGSGIQASGGTAHAIASNVVSNSGDHGVVLTSGVGSSVLRGNDVSGSHRTGVGSASGIDLAASSGNQLDGNVSHGNQGDGFRLAAGSDACGFTNNRSWGNGGAGFGHVSVAGTTHVGDLARANVTGFSLQGSTGTQLHNSIATDNVTGPAGFDLLVDAASVSGFGSDRNIFWNTGGQPPIQYDGVSYSLLSGFTAASGQDSRSIQADPGFSTPASGDFHLLVGSPAIDSGDSGVPGWPDRDAEGYGRTDDPGVSNAGTGPTAFTDRGALEFRPPQHLAALVATPGSGTDPLTVTLDASGSADPDGTYLTYEFDFGDGQLQVGQPTPTVQHVYRAGSWLATVVASDGAGHLASASTYVVVAVAAPEANLVTNPSFESVTTGWNSYGSQSMARVNVTGFEGSWSMQAIGPATTIGFGLNDSPNVVASATAGTRYRYTAWVRSSAGGGTARIRVQEFFGGTAVAARRESAPVRLSCLWQPVTLDFPAAMTGTTLDMQIVDVPMLRSEVFYVDGISVRVVAPPTTDVATDSLSLAPLVPMMGPNPMVDHATLRFATSRPGPLRVELYDVAGRRVRTLFQEAKAAAGMHTIHVDGRERTGGRLGSGLYFYRIVADEGSVTRSFLVTR